MTQVDETYEVFLDYMTWAGFSDPNEFKKIFEDARKRFESLDEDKLLVEKNRLEEFCGNCLLEKMSVNL